MEKIVPESIPIDERNFWVTNCYFYPYVLFWLADNGYLKYPEKTPDKRLCLFFWEE